jgi:hypothetical protein
MRLKAFPSTFEVLESVLAVAWAEGRAHVPVAVYWTCWATAAPQAANARNILRNILLTQQEIFGLLM